MSSLLVRADASAAIGAGHVMRTLAIAQAWQRVARGSVTYLCAALPPALEDRLRGEGCAVERIDARPGSEADRAATCDRIERGGALVLDGYPFDLAYQRACADRGARTLVLDDNADRDGYAASFVLNPSLAIEPAAYEARLDPGAALLLGPRYALLRREFAEAPARPEPAGEIERVVVSFGGSTPRSLVEVVRAGLADSLESSARIALVVGAASPELGAIRALVAEDPSWELCVDVQDMAALLCTADAALTAAGGTVWELLCIGVPFAVAAIADNQRDNERDLTSRGLALPLRTPDRAMSPDDVHRAIERLRSRTVRRELWARGRGTVDGQGAARAVRALLGERAE